MGRVEDHLGDRLRGRDIPDDLRRLVELDLDGVLRGPGTVQPFAEVHVLGPGEQHALEDQGYLSADVPAEIANGRAIDEVLGHMAVVVDGFNGDLFGYWLHPDEPATDRPAMVKLDTEGEFDTLYGSTLVEAMVFDWLGYDIDEDYLARIVAFCERHRLPLAARSREELASPEVVVHPAVLHSRLFRRYQPYTPRPAWADPATSLVGVRITDPPLRALLERIGFPDPAGTVEALDDGLGEVSLRSPVAPVTVTVYQDEDRSWWVYSAKYLRPTPERPLELPLPYGFSMHDSREATRERHGPPFHSALLVAVDRWRFGPVDVYVRFADDGLPAHIELRPGGIPGRG
jgi:hypothetical protein